MSRDLKDERSTAVKVIEAVVTEYRTCKPLAIVEVCGVVFGVFVLGMCLWMMFSLAPWVMTGITVAVVTVWRVLAFLDRNLP